MSNVKRGAQAQSKWHTSLNVKRPGGCAQAKGGMRPEGPYPACARTAGRNVGAPVIEHRFDEASIS